MAGEVGEALTGQRFADFRRSSNIEDRRDERGAIKNLLMTLGVKPEMLGVTSTPGLPPATFDPQDLDVSLENPTPLGVDAGYFNVQEEPYLHTMQEFLKRK